MLFLHGSKASRPLLECFGQVKNKDEKRQLRSRDKSRDRRTKEERKRWWNKDAVEKEEARTNGNGEAEERTMKRKNNCQNEGKKEKMGKERGEWKLYLLQYPRSFVSFYDGIFCWLFQLSPLAFNHRTNERTEQPTSEPISPPFRTGWNSATKFRKVSPREKSKTLESSRVFLRWHIFPRRKKDCYRLPKRSITKFLGSIVSSVFFRSGFSSDPRTNRWDIERTRNRLERIALIVVNHMCGVYL